MSSLSQKLRLILFQDSDPFQTEDVTANFQAIDTAPGTFICTSTARPTWDPSQVGRRILETDTGLEWWWDAAAFRRSASVGLLKTSDGNPAQARKTSNYGSSAATTYKVVHQISSVVIPDGRRPIRIVVNYAQAGQSDTTSNNSFAAIFQSKVDNSGTNLREWALSVGSTGAVKSSGSTIELVIANGLPAGTYDFSLQAKNVNTGGALTIYATALQPIEITVFEL